MSYKKVKTVLVYGKKKCIYMKPKGTREYVKSKGEYVLLPVYVKRVAKIAAKKLVKIKNGKKKIRGGEHEQLSLQVIDVDNNVLDLCKITDLNTELVLLCEETIRRQSYINNSVNIEIQVKDEDIYRDSGKDEITTRIEENMKTVIKTIPKGNYYSVVGKPHKGTTYYKRYNNGTIKKIYSTTIVHHPRDTVYYHSFHLKEGETIYSEKYRCKLLIDENGYNKFNIEDVKNILFDYKPPFEKLYIYDSNGYKEIDVPNPLQGRNVRALAKYNSNLQNPVTHTRMVFKTPNSHSNRVTADIVDNYNPQKSKQSMISKIVGKVKLTTLPGPTYATNDPFKNHYRIKDAYEKSLQKSTLSKIKNVFSRKNTHKGPSLYDGRSG